MLVKTLTVRQFATVKRVAQNVNPLVVKRSKLFAKIEELNEEIAAINEEVSGHEMGIKALTGGMTSEQLVNKLVEDTGKTDKDGKPIKVTKYEPKEGTVVFNANDNVYEIHVEEFKIEDPLIENTSNLNSNNTMNESECETIENSMNLPNE